mmetsp:Transcript_114047/g.221513  ORF Transcript_114047/g.221513 Transcript_114047/m.221513 type:complete len:242 (-) Transcript_114047:119-844(-)
MTALSSSLRVALALRGSLRKPCTLGATALQRTGLSMTASPVVPRAISTAASAKLLKVVQAEIKHEQEQYEQIKDIKNFLKNSPFKLIDKDGDVNMALERETEDKTVRIEWQLASPFDPEAVDDAEGGEADPQTTEMAVIVEDKKTGAGLTFYCSTQTGEDHRYIIGMVKTFDTAGEKESETSYNGPDFEDLDDKLQESFDEYLADLGMSSEVCDFVDAMAMDKEQREYVRWLKSVQKFMEC